MPIQVEGGAPSASAETTLKVLWSGTHRSQTLDSTVQSALHLAPVMGITRVADVTGLDAIGIPVVMVCRPNSRSVAVSQGKGIDLPSARASGLMEAIELYHAETITLPLRLASYEELRYRHNVVEPGTISHSIASRFHPSLRLLWIEGRDLLTEKTLLVPYEIVHTNYTLPPPDGYGCFNASSNGLASGNHILEAISHGLCEVVERDATTLWKLRRKERLERGRIDLSSVNDGACQQLLARFEAAEVGVAVWDITTEIGIPAFACFVLPWEESELWYSPTVAAGFGCHPSRAVALARALTEAAQSRLTLIAGSRDDFGSEVYDPCLDEALMSAIHGESNSSEKRRFEEIPTWESETLQADVEWELQCLQRAGLEHVIVVDLTKPEFAIPVVRVVVPGLESMLAPDYLPGPRGRDVLKV